MKVPLIEKIRDSALYCTSSVTVWSSGHPSTAKTVWESNLKAHEVTKQSLEEELRQHKETATKSREYYKSCQDKCKTSWSDIVKLSDKNPRTAAEREELEALPILP